MISIAAVLEMHRIEKYIVFGCCVCAVFVWNTQGMHALGLPGKQVKQGNGCNGCKV